MPEADAPNAKRDFFDWPLAPLMEVPPELLIANTEERDDIDNLFLSLALLFNDLKTALLLLSWLESNKVDDEITPRRGQHTGIAIHMHRYGFAILHELLQLINENRAIFQGPVFAEIRRKHLLKGFRQMWDELYAEATSTTTGRALLRRMRNDTIFHYGQPKTLVAAYREVFFKDPKTPSNTHAYASVGNTMEETRFYYADAAAQRAFALIASQVQVDNAHAAVLPILERANNALVGLIGAFVSYKMAEHAKKRGVRLPRGPRRKKPTPRRKKPRR